MVCWRAATPKGDSMRPSFERYGFSYTLWRIIWAPFWLFARCFSGQLGLAPPERTTPGPELGAHGGFHTRRLRPRFVDWLRPLLWPLSLLWFVLRPVWFWLRRVIGRPPQNPPGAPATLKWWELYMFRS